MYLVLRRESGQVGAHICALHILTLRVLQIKAVPGGGQLRAAPFETSLY
jgi:hypothetical protein